MIVWAPGPKTTQTSHPAARMLIDPLLLSPALHGSDKVLTGLGAHPRKSLHPPPHLRKPSLLPPRYPMAHGTAQIHPGLAYLAIKINIRALYRVLLRPPSFLHLLMVYHSLIPCHHRLHEALHNLMGFLVVRSRHRLLPQFHITNVYL